MSLYSIRQFLSATFIIAALAACAPIQAPATSDSTATPVTATAEPTGEPTPEAMPIEGVDTAACDTLQAALSAQLKHELTKQEGSNCTLTATGTGEEFGTLVDVSTSIGGVLEANGWTQDATTQADGPTGTAVSYFKDLTVASVSVSWEPSDEVDCPTDQPISACEVEPSQQIFTITIDVVQIA